MSYDGLDETEEEQSSAGDGSDAEQETDAGEEEGDSLEGRADSLGTGEGYIYFLESQDAKFIKIGFSKNVIKRVADLGTIMPMKLIGCLAGSKRYERQLHRKFISCRSTGEWFHATPFLRECIATLKLIPPDSDPTQRPPLLLETFTMRLHRLHKKQTDMTSIRWSLPMLDDYEVSLLGREIPVPLDPDNLLSGACDWIDVTEITAEQINLYLTMINAAQREENRLFCELVKLRDYMRQIGPPDTPLLLLRADDKEAS